MDWDLGISTAAALTLLVLAVFQVPAGRYISDGDLEELTFTDGKDPPGCLRKTLKIAFISPRIGRQNIILKTIIDAERNKRY